MSEGVMTAPEHEAPPSATIGTLAIAAGAVQFFAAGTVADDRRAVAVFAVLGAVQLLWGIVSVRYARRALGGVGVLVHLIALATWVGVTTSGLSFVEGLEDARPFDATAAIATLLSAIAGLASLARLVDARPAADRRVPSDRMVWAVTTFAAVAVVIASVGAAGDAPEGQDPVPVATATTVPGPIGLPTGVGGDIDQQLGSLIQASESTLTDPETTPP